MKGQPFRNKIHWVRRWSKYSAVASGGRLRKKLSFRDQCKNEPDLYRLVDHAADLKKFRGIFNVFNRTARLRNDGGSFYVLHVLQDWNFLAVCTSIGGTLSSFEIVSEHLSGTGPPDLSEWTILAKLAPLTAWSVQTTSTWTWLLAIVNQLRRSRNTFHDCPRHTCQRRQNSEECYSVLKRYTSKKWQMKIDLSLQ